MESAFQMLKTDAVKKEAFEIPNHMQYRDYRDTPASPSSSIATTVISAGDNPFTPDTPSSIPDDPIDQTLTCPPSPPAIFGKKDDRLHNDLLDELCTDMGLKDAMELDFFDEMDDENYIDQFMATEDYPSTTHSGLMSPVSHSSSNSQSTVSDSIKDPNKTPSGSRMHSAAPSPERERKMYDRQQDGAFKSPTKPAPRALPQVPLNQDQGSLNLSTPGTPTRKSVTFANQNGQPGVQKQTVCQAPPQQYPQHPGNQGYPRPGVPPNSGSMQGQIPVQGHQNYSKNPVWTRPSNPEKAPRTSTMHYKPPTQGGFVSRPPVKQEGSGQHPMHGGYPTRPGQTQPYPMSVKQEGRKIDPHNFDSASIAASDLQSDQGYSSCDLASTSTSSRPSSRATTLSHYGSMESVDPSGPTHAMQGHHGHMQMHGHGQQMMGYRTNVGHQQQMWSGPPPIQKSISSSSQGQGQQPSQQQQHMQKQQLPQQQQQLPQQQQQLPQQQQGNQQQQTQQHNSQTNSRSDSASNKSGLKSPLQKLAELNQSITDDYNQHVIEKAQVVKNSPSEDLSSEGTPPSITPLGVKADPSILPSSCAVSSRPQTPTGKATYGPTPDFSHPDQSFGSMGQQEPVYPNRLSIKRMNSGQEKIVVPEPEVYNAHIEAMNGVGLDWNSMGAKPKSHLLQQNMQNKMSPGHVQYSSGQGYWGSHSQPTTPSEVEVPQGMNSQSMGPGCEWAGYQNSQQAAQQQQQQHRQQQQQHRQFVRSHSYPAYSENNCDQMMQFNNQYERPKGFQQDTNVYQQQKQQVDLNQNMSCPQYSMQNTASPQVPQQGMYQSPGQRQEMYNNNNNSCQQQSQGGYAQQQQKAAAYTQQQQQYNQQTTQGVGQPPPYNNGVQGQQMYGGQNSPGHYSGQYAQSHTPPIRHHPYQGSGDRGRLPPSYGQHYQQGPSSCAFDEQQASQVHNQQQSYIPPQGKMGMQDEYQPQSCASGSIEPQTGMDPAFNRIDQQGFNAQQNQFMPIQGQPGMPPADVQPGLQPEDIPADWPPQDKVTTSQHSFMQRIVSDKSSAFRSHPLFPLLRDLIVADMNFHNSSFPYQLISSLPTDFNRLLQNYLQRTPPSGDYQSNHAIDSIVMDSLKYAHKSLIEKIQQKKDEATFGQSTGPMSAIEDFCSKFDQAVRNSINKDDMGQPCMGPPEHLVQVCNQPEQGYFKDPNRPSQLHVDCLENNNSDADSLKSCKSSIKNPGEVRKHPVLPKEAVAIMLSWLKEHREKPYPSDEEKACLMEQTKLTINQINYWFVNARRRILPKWKQLEAEGKTISIKTK